MPSEEAATHTRYVARQPIFDRERGLIGYELLYRAHAGSLTAAATVGAVEMSSATVVGGILDIGLDRLVGPVPAWINVPDDLLLSGVLEVLDPRRVVLEILETVTPTTEVVAACARLRQQGFTLALDDFAGDGSWEPLLALARIVKLDVLGVPAETLRPQIERLRRFPVRLLAERVEDQAAFAMCAGLGFDYFQGYHFRQPEVVGRRALPVGMARVARLMALVGDPDVSDQRIEEELRGDPGLSVKLLRIVNNAATGHREVASLRHAIQLAGRRALHHWLAMLLVTTIPAADDADRETILSALERGRFCELLALGTQHRALADPLFLVGLLADLDRLLGVTMEELVLQLGLSEEVGAALCGAPGSHTPYLVVANAYAAGAWSRVTEIAGPLGVAGALPELYSEAGDWARQVLHGG
jgi:EAL and modified HD-GYP domain-containing signal transduction protein